MKNSPLTFTKEIISQIWEIIDLYDWSFEDGGEAFFEKRGTNFILSEGELKGELYSLAKKLGALLPSKVTFRWETDFSHDLDGSWMQEREETLSREAVMKAVCEAIERFAKPNGNGFWVMVDEVPFDLLEHIKNM